MLNGATEFPCVGSYGLLLSPPPPAQQRQAGDPNEEVQGPQLVRILRLPSSADGLVLVSLPLRDGAGGTRAVPFSDLIDATPLTGAEGKEFVELGRELRQSRVIGRKRKQERYEALRQRAIYAPILGNKLKLLQRQRRSDAGAARNVA